MKYSDKVKRLACLLMSYEMDEPHADLPDLKDENPHYPEIDWDKIEKDFLNLEHDCLIPGNHGCPRCFAEMIMHKAQWIVEKSEEQEKTDEK